MKINYKSISEQLSNKEMKNITGGGEDASKFCCWCDRNSNGEIISDGCDPAMRCATDAYCQRHWGSGATCSGSL